MARLIVVECAHPEIGNAPNCEIEPAAAEPDHPLAVANPVQNPGLAHGPGFEWVELASGPASVSGDGTKLSVPGAPARLLAPVARWAPAQGRTR